MTVLGTLPVLTATAAEPVRSVEIMESSAFLEGYRTASAAQSADFYDLYSDRALIHVRVQGHAEGMAFQGRAFKTWGRELLRQGRAGPDGSVFHEPTVEQRGGRLLIRAKRYSTTRCYWDLNYQVGIEREGSTYRIVDERLTMQPTAQCAIDHVRSASPSVTTLLPTTFSSSPPVGSGQMTEPETTRWHPLSQQELADKAMQLAQQMAAARAAQSRASAASALALSGASPLPVIAAHESSTNTPVSHSDGSLDLRITPEGSP